MKHQGKIFIVAMIIFLGLAIFLARAPQTEGKYDEFALCLAEKGVIFYGTFWCPHCQDQKAIFGASSKKLPYIECSTPDGKGQLKICTDEGITSYPTWVFSDGDRVTGVQSFEFLSEKTECSLSN